MAENEDEIVAEWAPRRRTQRVAKAKDELESVQQSQQTQQMALLEALNAAQTENDGLRSQLRAKK